MPKYDDIPVPPIVVPLQPGTEQDVPLVQTKDGGRHDIFVRLVGYPGKKLLEYSRIMIRIYDESTSPSTIVREHIVYDTAFGTGGFPIGTHRINLKNEGGKPETVHLKIYSY